MSTLGPPRPCELCGQPVRSTIGIWVCQRSPECLSEYRRAYGRRRRALPPELQRKGRGVKRAKPLSGQKLAKLMRARLAKAYEQGLRDMTGRFRPCQYPGCLACAATGVRLCVTHHNEEVRAARQSES